MSSKRLYLIDATAFCYRAFYALPSLATSFGQPTGAIYGFINMLNKVLKKNKPEYLGVCFDVSRDTFRQKKFAEYKIHRPPMPDALSGQIPLIKEIIAAYGITILEQAGYEADDIIATAAKKAKTKGLATTIISSDKDILQLVDEQTLVFSPYKDEGVTYDDKKVRERFGVGPQSVVDIIALMGDDVDNIPGIPGIGEKTAVELIKKFGSLDNLLKRLDKITREKLRSAIEDNIDKIRLNQELAVLRERSDIEVDLEKLKIGQSRPQELLRLFKYLEFKKLANELSLPADDSRKVKLEAIGEKALKELIDTGAELFLYGQSLEEMVFCAQGKFFQADKENSKGIAEVLASPKVKKTGFGLKEIKMSLAKDNIALAGLSFDLEIAAHLLNPAKSEYDLADIAWDYLAKSVAKVMDNQAALSLILELKPKLEQELEAKLLSGLFRDLEMPLVEVLARLQICGIKLDIKALKKLSQDIEARLIKLIEDIYAASGEQFNINSPKQLRDILFERLKLPVVKKTKTGASTDEEVLRALAPQHKLPALLLEYRQLMKLKTTYVDTLPDAVDAKTGRLHTSFNQTATETGRLSSSNPNLQNIPVKTDIGRKIRQAIIASGEGYFLLSGDYSQVELRILAHLSGDENLIHAFKHNKDIHKATASLVYGLEEKDVTDSMREVAKRVNFGIVYGLSAYGLSRDLGISKDQAQGFIDAYFVRYPRVKEYIQEQIKKAQQDNFVTTILGRRRYISEINNKNQNIRQFAERQAVNTPIQGSASDLIKLAMIEIDSQIQAKKLKSRMIMQIHDELVFDLPEKELKELAALAKDRMENVLKLSVPIIVDIKYGQNWLDMEPA